MGIESYFVPSNALQGEEIPSFILWKNINYDKIEVITSEYLELLDIFNVSENDYSINQNNIIVHSVEVDGYLGLLFKSKKSSDIIVNINIIFSFYRDNNIILKRSGNVSLFRPQIELVYQPSKIHVIDGNIKKNEKIRLKNIGEGTSVIVFKNNEKSELKIEKPANMEEFIERVDNSFIEEIKQLKILFSDYENELDDVIFLTTIGYDPEDEKSLNEYKERSYRIDKAFAGNEKLLYYTLQAYIISILKNINIITAMEQFLDYLLSIGSGRVIIANSLDIINLSKDSKNVEFEIHYTDLLDDKLPSIPLNPIIVESNKDIEISIYNFFKWEDEKVE